MEIKHLIDQAIEARKQAYTPYSNFQVGAAVLTIVILKMPLTD
jgi:cytidine deaminase